MGKQKYYKYNINTKEVIEEYLETDEDTLILLQNPLMEEEQLFQNDEILTAQEAINFILMSGSEIMSSYSLYKTNKTQGGVTMGKYLGDQIYRNNLDYDEVIARYPQFQVDIDARLQVLAEKDGLKFK